MISRFFTGGLSNVPQNLEDVQNFKDADNLEVTDNLKDTGKVANGRPPIRLKCLGKRPAARSQLSLFLLLFGVFTPHQATAQEGVSFVLEPPSLDYQALCRRATEPANNLLDRDWTLWEGAPLDVDARTAVQIAEHYMTQSQDQEASPETAVRLLKVALEQYPAERRTILYPLSRALIGLNASEDDLFAAEGYLLELHAQGYDRAAYALSEFYGDEGPAQFRDFGKSIDYLRLSALAGDRLGVVDYAQYVSKNASFSAEEQRAAISRAFFTLLDQLRKGDCRSLRLIGAFYNRGVLVKQDPNLALKWFEKAAEGGDYKTAEFLSREFVSRRLVQMDLAKSLKYLKQAADGGIAVAQFNLGKAYLSGVSIGQDIALAERYMLSAALEGSIYAHHYLARLYSGEFGGAIKDDEARSYFEKSLNLSADSNTLRVRYSQYLLRHGTEEDQGRAIEILHQAAQSGSADAGYELGKIYLKKGRTDNRYWFYAHDFLTDSALRGHSDSAARLAEIYSCGLGVDRSNERSRYWLKHAATNGRSYSLFRLGVTLLASTKGEDKQRGWTLIKQAAYKGSAPAIGYAVARWEKTAGEFEARPQEAEKLIRFTNRLADPEKRDLIKVAITQNRYEIADSDAQRSKLIASLDPLIERGSLAALAAKADMLRDFKPANSDAVQPIYQRLADLGDARAQRELATLLSRDFSQDMTRVTALLQQAAEAGDVKAKMRLIDPASPSAMATLNALAKAGLVCSISERVELARLYAAVPNEDAPAKAREWLSLAAQTSPQSEGEKYSLASAYRDGIAGVEARAKAEGYFSQVLALGRTSVLLDLAEGHMAGIWTNSSPAKAKKHYQKLAALGDLKAANRLLRHIADGRLQARAEEVAALLDQVGDALADPAKTLLKLATRSRNGELGDTNERLAYDWLVTSAESGEPTSMYQLFQKYFYGIGISENPDLAVDWLKKSAELGHVKAARDLAVAYQMGLPGLTPDAELGSYWQNQYEILSQ